MIVVLVLVLVLVRSGGGVVGGAGVCAAGHGLE